MKGCETHISQPYVFICWSHWFELMSNTLSIFSNPSRPRYAHLAGAATMKISTAEVK